MGAVLGIDAAWTSTRSSGVALAAQGPGGWRLVAVETSYQRFHALASSSPLPISSGSFPIAADLLASAARLCGRPIDLVAIDMPLSRTPIVARRASDNAVSRAYGARKCGTHSPSATRPGQISDELRAGFATAGYPLRTTTFAPPGLIEVYPHPALVEFAGVRERLPYKAARTRFYWPALTPTQRRDALFAQWRDIVVLLEQDLAGVADALPTISPDAKGAPLKAYEDALDAVICACVAIRVLEARAKPYGDEDSAIWIPTP